MRIAAIILVIIGTILSVGLGGKWLSDYNQYKDQIKAAAALTSSLTAHKDKTVVSASSEMDKALAQVDTLRLCGIFLIIGGVLSLVMVFLSAKIKMVSAGALVLLGVIPGILSPLAFVVTFFGILGGILVFFSKPKTAR
jgi:hypothetical protein